VWIQTKKLTCVDPNFTSVDPNQKLNLCGSKTKSVTSVDPKQKKSELVWIQNRKNGANRAVFHHRAESGRWAIAADPEAHFFWPEPAAARQDTRHERAEFWCAAAQVAASACRLEPPQKAQKKLAVW